MCGIAGMWGRGEVGPMLEKISHRGPDGRHVYSGKKVKLGACYLNIMDAENGSQPLSNETKDIWIALNGEIYNYVELRKGLKKRHEFASSTDTEVILHLFEERGLEFLKECNGCFALAIWDGKRLILARDRLGQKPLYYYHKNNRFIFASEIKAILTQVQTTPLMPENFKVFETPVGKETLFKDIFSVEPASYLIFDGEKIKTGSYWELRSQETSLSEKKYIDTLRWLLEDSIKIHLRGEADYGLFLSGGIDSSLLAFLSRPKHVFSCHYPELGSRFNEIEYASTVAKAIGAKHHIIRPGPEDFKEFFPKLIWHLDYPLATASPFSLFMLAKEASREVKVVLSGEGADELFGGYIRYLLMKEEERIFNIPELCDYHDLARFFWSKEMFGEPAQRYFYLISRGQPETSKPLAFVRKIFDSHTDLMNRMSATDIAINLIPLLMMGDRACAAFGAENRCPYLDYRIVEFAFCVPQDLKIRGTKTKYLLKKAAEGIVPYKIYSRSRKQGLISPIQSWLAGPLRGWARSKQAKGLPPHMRINRIGGRGGYDRSLYMDISLKEWLRIFWGNRYLR